MVVPSPPELSVVIPFLNEEGSLGELIHQVVAVVDGMGRSFEIIAVDDGSTDGSFDLLRRRRESEPRLKVLRFRRNFGKSYALAAGFREATGGIVLTLDADLQDDPQEIPRFVAAIEAGWDVVSGWKRVRHDPLGKVIPSRLFNTMTRLVSGVKIHDMNCGFKAYRLAAARSVRLYGEMHRFVPCLAHREGFRVTEIEVTHHPRRHGRTKFGVERFLRGLLDFITVMFLGRYAHRPMHYFGGLGLVVGTIGFGICAHLTRLWVQGQTIGDRPLLMLGVLLLLVGVQLFSIGLVGEMITQSAQRPDRVDGWVAERLG